MFDKVLHGFYLLTMPLFLTRLKTRCLQNLNKDRDNSPLMKEVIRTEILYDLTNARKILQQEDPQDVAELKELSDHAIDDVAAHKDLDLVAITVLIYSLYKIGPCILGKNRSELLNGLTLAIESLQEYQFGRYNSAVKGVYAIVQKCNVKVKEHLDDIMHAAKVKKGAVLLGKGLSLGQAAGLMGLSNWDLQVYAGKTTAISEHKENIPVDKRLKIALQLFGVHLRGKKA